MNIPKGRRVCAADLTSPSHSNKPTRGAIAVHSHGGRGWECPLGWDDIFSYEQVAKIIMPRLADLDARLKAVTVESLFMSHAIRHLAVYAPYVRKLSVSRAGVSVSALCDALASIGNTSVDVTPSNYDPPANDIVGFERKIGEFFKMLLQVTADTVPAGTYKLGSTRGFIPWLRNQIERQDPVGDLARDYAEQCRIAKKQVTLRELKRYLADHGCVLAQHAMEDALDEFRRGKADTSWLYDESKSADQQVQP